MRKIWGIVAGMAILVVALAIGVWVGVTYHDRLAPGIRVSGSANPHDASATAASSPGAVALGSMPATETLYHCGMHPWIIQDHPGICPICHMKLTPIRADAATAAVAKRKVLYYWDPMLGPSSISPKPGKSAMGMDLVPVYADQNSGGPAIIIDPAVVQNMGVQTAVATMGELHKTLRTVGYLEALETGFHDVTLKVSGYIDKLHADRTGMHLRKGDPLFDLYSPDLIVAEDELIAATQSTGALSHAAPEVRAQAQSLIESARRKLQLLDIPNDVINRIATLKQAPREITIDSPADGYLRDKNIVQGSSVKAGMQLMRIESHRTLWLEAQVYEQQLSLLRLGQSAQATLDAFPGRTFSGKIVFIDPRVDHPSRTTNVRVELDNPGLLLKPGMYASVLIHSQPVDHALLVPREAVIDTGTRKIVFIAEAGGHFSPRLVTTGLSGDDDQMQILSGLAPGEIVVTSGQFLMDVESRTQEAIEKLRTPEQSPQTQPAYSVSPTTSY